MGCVVYEVLMLLKELGRVGFDDLVQFMSREERGRLMEVEKVFKFVGLAVYDVLSVGL